MAADDEQEMSGPGQMSARDRDAPSVGGVASASQEVEGTVGSGPSFEEFESQYSGSQQTGMIDPTFSGSNAVIDVDTFADIRAAERRTAQRNMANDPTFSGSNAVIDVDTFTDAGAFGKKQRADMTDMFRDFKASQSIEDFSNLPDAIARTNAMNASELELGSVNLAPVGINVGYKSTFNPTISFDQLNASTKAAVKAAGIQSQSEDETENSIAAIMGNWLAMIKKADKNIDNRTPIVSTGPDN